MPILDLMIGMKLIHYLFIDSKLMQTYNLNEDKR